jgi:hypothetical protein
MLQRPYLAVTDDGKLHSDGVVYSYDEVVKLLESGSLYLDFTLKAQRFIFQFKGDLKALQEYYDEDDAS